MMFITSKNKYLSNDMKLFGTCSIPLKSLIDAGIQSMYVYWIRPPASISNPGLAKYTLIPHLDNCVFGCPKC